MPNGTKRGRNAPTAPRDASLVALHRSRMFDWKPSAVVAIAPCPGAPLFAVGYESGTLELWDIQQLVCTHTVVGPSLEITSLAWARDTVSNTWRTFAAFLDGSVAEVAWRQSAVSYGQDSYGGVVWALAASPVECVKPGFAHPLAAACDDGSVRLFGCEGGEPGLVAERVLARLEGRLLTCCWMAGGRRLAVAGSSGNAHVLDAVTGREQLRITVSPSASRTVTVWRLAALPDGTLVSGDSEGGVGLWDSAYGTALQRFSQHKADVTALAVTNDGNTIFASGVDAQVAMFTRVPGTSGRPDSWAYTHYKRPHTHDVRALAVAEESVTGRGSVLISGGVDAQLIAYPVASFLEEHPTRLTRCPQRPICRATAPPASPAPVAAAGPASASFPSPPGRLLVAQDDTLDLWQLAEAAAPRANYGPPPQHYNRGQAPMHPWVTEGEPLELLAGPRHLARIKVKGGRVAAAALSSSGSFLAATTPAGTRVYELGRERSGAADAPAASAAVERAMPVTVRRVRLEGGGEEPAAAVAVTNAQVILAQAEGQLVSYSLPSGEVEARSQPRGGQPGASTAAQADANTWRGYAPTVSQLVASDDGSLVAAVGRTGVTLYSLPALQQHGRVLRTDGAVTAIAFSRDGRLLAAATAHCHLYVWDTTDCKQVQWALDNQEAATAAIARLPGCPTCISFCPGTAPSPPPTAAAEDAPAAAATPAAGSTSLPYKLVVNSPGGLVNMDLSRPVDGDYVKGLNAKRRRGPLRPDQRPLPEDRPEGRGANGRVIRTTHPCVWLGHVGTGELLLLEKPWEEVLAALPPPLYVHRYGS